MAKIFTPLDEEAYRKVRKCGFVSVELSSSARRLPLCCLESNDDLDWDRMMRLVEFGLLKSNNDGLFDGFPQTYSPVEIEGYDGSPDWIVQRMREARRKRSVESVRSQWPGRSLLSEMLGSGDGGEAKG